MRITLDDQSHVSDLLRFLRERGCIAFVGADVSTIEVIRTRAFGMQESNEIRQLAGAWQTVRGVEVVLRFRE